MKRREGMSSVEGQVLVGLQVFTFGLAAFFANYNSLFCTMQKMTHEFIQK